MNGVRLLFAISRPRPLGVPDIYVAATEGVQLGLLTRAWQRPCRHFNKLPTKSSEVTYKQEQYFSASFKPLTRSDISSPDSILWRLA
jgi:hypothetical protein